MCVIGGRIVKLQGEENNFMRGNKQHSGNVCVYVRARVCVCVCVCV